MEKEIRNEIRKMVEAARSLLEQEIQEQLEGVYGLHKDGTLEDLSSLPQTKDDQKAIKAREGFEYFINNDVTQGVKIEESVKKLILGLSFTHLNRIIALKLMERRKVIKESVSRKTNSNGFKFYLADFPEQEELWRSGKEDEAYKNFLLHQYGKISEEIHVLFDPEDVSNLVFPRPRSLYSLLDLINQDSLADVWEEDETIGWIYQYFTPKELREKARAESAAPRNSYELAFRNQFYTPRYVVRFLTDNTLGRMWYEMQKGETRLAEVCEYMVKRPNEIFLEEGQAPPEVEENTEKTQEDLFKEPFYIPFRTKKDPRDIKILDPACGSGHFLLYCFDLMLIIYEEAYNDPDLSSLLKKDYPSFEEYRNAIPGLILRHNLHGIDIDLRASQIASLAVWLRGQKEYQKIGIKSGERPKITKSNIVCAEPMPGDKKMLGEFKKTLEPSVLGDLVKDIWGKMKLAGEAGSLLKIERMIKESVAEAEEAWRTRPKEIQLDLYGNKKFREQLRFNISGINEIFWDEAEELVLDSLKRFSEEASNGKTYSRKLFAENAAQGFAFIDLMRMTYDVVLMNPPFGTASFDSKSYIDSNYARTKNDLYATFVERMLEVLHERGFIGIISSRTGFFLSSFTKWREEILMQESSLHSMADFGFGVLEAMVETAAYTIEKVNSIGKKAVFFRLLKINENEKGDALLKAINNENSEKRFIVNIDSFSFVPNSPFSYWVNDRIRYKFKEFSPFEGNGGNVKQGLATADDFRFIRANWEVSPNNIVSVNWKEWEVTKDATIEGQQKLFIQKTHEGKQWVNFAKGGEYSPYYSDIHLVVNWGGEGEEIWNNLNEKGNVRSNIWMLKDTINNFFFRTGLTWTYRTDKGFSVRVKDAGTIHSHVGHSAFPFHNLEYQCLCWLNSVATEFFLRLMTTYKWEVGYVQNLPFPFKNENMLERDAMINLFLIYQSYFRYNETTHIFLAPALLTINSQTLQESFTLLDEEKIEKQKRIELFQKEIDEIFYDLYNIDPEDRKMIEDELTEKESNYRVDKEHIHAQNLIQWCIGVIFGRWDIRMILNRTFFPKLPNIFDPLPLCSPGMLVGPDGMPAIEGQIASEEWLQARKNVLDVPENVPNPTISNNEYPLEIEWDGILVDDSGHQDDIIKRMRDVLDLLWKDKAQNIEKKACEILREKSLRDYFHKKFFDFHIKRYSKSRRKAPIYWQLSTKNRNYSLWLYYHRLTSDTLFLALRKYVDPKVGYEETKLKEMKDKLESGKEILPRSQLTKMEKEIEKKADLVLEIKEFRKTLERIAQKGYDPDSDDGVILNMAPLDELIPWKEPPKYWKELEEGKYDWAHIAMKYWPERVKEKCKKDKSLAIAHGLEELYGAD